MDTISLPVGSGEQIFIDSLIERVRTAQEAESITAEMVSRIFDFLNRGLKEEHKKTVAIENEAAEREKADAYLGERIDDAVNRADQADDARGREIDAETRTRQAADEVLDRAINRMQAELDLCRQMAQRSSEAVDIIMAPDTSQAIDNFTEVIEFLRGMRDKDHLATLLNTFNNGIDDLSQSLTELRLESQEADIDLNARIDDTDKTVSNWKDNVKFVNSRVDAVRQDLDALVDHVIPKINAIEEQVLSLSSDMAEVKELLQKALYGAEEAGEKADGDSQSVTE